MDSTAVETLKNLIERIESLEEEKSQTQELIKEVFAELKAEGFDATIVRQVLKLRKMTEEDLEEQESLIDLYMEAVRGHNV